MERNINCSCCSFELLLVSIISSRSSKLLLIVAITVAFLLKGVDLSTENSLTGQHFNYAIFHVSNIINGFYSSKTLLLHTLFQFHVLIVFLNYLNYDN